MPTVGRRTHHQVTFSVLAAGIAAYALLQSLITPVLTTVQQQLHTTQATATWALTGYLLSASVFTPIMGRIGDMRGKKRVFVVTLIALTLGSLLAALATNITVMILARVIQGIVTGLGFLGAGVILHEGFSTRGLTSAASIWISSAIGVMVGIGFYLAAIALSLIAVFCMTLLTRFENWLPSRQGIAVTLVFEQSFKPSETDLAKFALARGYEINSSSIAVKCCDGKAEWHFIASALGRHNEVKLTELAAELRGFHGIESFQLNHARN